MKKSIKCDCGSLIEVKRTSSGLACKKCRDLTSGLEDSHRTNIKIKKNPLDLQDFGKLNTRMTFE